MCQILTKNTYNTQKNIPKIWGGVNGLFELHLQAAPVKNKLLFLPRFLPRYNILRSLKGLKTENINIWISN